MKLVPIGIGMSVVLALMPTCALSLEEDKLQEIVITGDSASLDENTGEITYRGSVTLSQGSLKLGAEILRAKREGGQVVQISASQGDSSEPVSYSQRIQIDEPEVTAVANEMVYDIQAQTIQLTGNAVLEQSEVEFRGDSILYDIARGRTEAAGQVQMKLPGRFLSNLEGEEGEDSQSDPP